MVIGITTAIASCLYVTMEFDYNRNPRVFVVVPCMVETRPVAIVGVVLLVVKWTIGFVQPCGDGLPSTNDIVAQRTCLAITTTNCRMHCNATCMFKVNSMLIFLQFFSM